MLERNTGINYDFSITTFAKEQPFTPGRKDEDASLVINNNERAVAFIVDGGTALSTITSAPHELFNGYFAANTAVSGVKKNFSVCNTASSLLLTANEEIKIRLKENRVDPNTTESEFLPTCGGASLILINKVTNETQISQIGDTAVLVFFKNGNSRIAINPSVNFDDIRAYETARKISQSNHISIKSAFNDQAVSSVLTAGRHKENISKGYGALNGKDYAVKFIKSKTYKTSQITKIIAMSDGMFPPQNEFDGKPKWTEIAKQITELGPDNFYQEKVYKIKESDPELIKFPRFKKHDDARLIVINLAPLF